jgi:putative glutamine transport system substrate-binding protein
MTSSHHRLSSALGLAALALFVGSVARAESETLARIRQRDRLVVGTELAFPTLNFKDPATGRCEGFMADLAHALAQRLLGDGSKVEFHPVNDQTRFDDVNGGVVDLLIDTVPISEERAKIVGLSDETFRSGSALLVKQGSPIRSIDDLKPGTRVAYVTANPDVKVIRAKAPDATFLEFEKSGDAMAALKDGRADVFTQVVTHLYRAASQNPGYVLVGRFTSKPYGMVTKKGDDELRATLNDFLKALRASGEYDRLFQKWFAAYGGDNVR